jgi:uncharacterized protein (DUF433 family)
MMVQSQLYSVDLRDVAIYRPAQAAHYINIHPATLRSWFSGRSYPIQTGTARFEAVLEPASFQPVMLSFNNLVEALVLKLLRQRHKVPMKTIREALELAGQQFNIERPFLRNTLSAAFGELFVEQFGQMIHLRAHQQLALKGYFAAHALRVDVDEQLRPLRYYPFIDIWQALDTKIDKPIVIDPAVGFGQPTIAGTGVLTSVIIDRINAHETIEDIATDYDAMTSDHVRAALAFQAA